MSRRTYCTALLVLAGVCLPHTTVFAVAGDYVAAIEADVAEFSTGNFVPPLGSSWLGSGESGSADDGTASLASFEDFLKRRFPGTHILYLGLNEPQKTEVWQDYVKTGDLGGIRTNIFALRSGRSRVPQGPAITNLPQD